MNLTRLEQWLLKRILAKLMRQQSEKHGAVPELFKMVRVAYSKEFYEDNEFTSSVVLKQWFESTETPLVKRAFGINH